MPDRMLACRIVGALGIGGEWIVTGLVHAERVWRPVVLQRKGSLNISTCAEA